MRDTLHADKGFAIPLMMLKQFHIKSLFRCLKATAMDKQRQWINARRHLLQSALAD